jgi:hypothetical protein
LNHHFNRGKNEGAYWALKGHIISSHRKKKIKKNKKKTKNKEKRK